MGGVANLFFNINKTLKVFSFLTWFFVLQIPQVSADTNVSLNSIEIGKSGTIEVNSDSLKIDSNAEIATFDGNVEIKLNKIILKAQKITVTYSTDENSKQEITEILAINDVFFISNKDITKSDKALYSLTDNTIKLSGNILINQGSTSFSGEELSINLDTGQGTMSGRVKAILGSDE